MTIAPDPHADGPRSFTLPDGTVIPVRITAFGVARVRDDLGENLAELISTGYERLTSDIVLFLDVLYTVADPKIDRDAFFKAFETDSLIIDALGAFSRACSDFYRSLPIGRVATMLFAKTVEAHAMASEQVAQRLTEIDSTPITQILADAGQTRSSDSCTRSEACSASTPAPCPSGNSTG